MVVTRADDTAALDAPGAFVCVESYGTLQIVVIPWWPSDVTRHMIILVDMGVFGFLLYLLTPQ
jgi:hypothetical protein